MTTVREHIDADENRAQPDDGIALCLSGGGYRAMLFHVGAVLRLNEMGVLTKLSRVSSVSGGSITAAVLANHWARLHVDSRGRVENLLTEVVEPICKLASTTIDRGSILGGVLLPGSVNDRIVTHYRDILFGRDTLQNFPSDDKGPRFVITATNVQSGALVRFSRPYLADYRVGMIQNPKILIAEAVAASSAFPPFLSPAELDLDPDAFMRNPQCDLQQEPYTDTMLLTDGGVYDNLGLEPAWKRYRTILVSDGGGKMQAEPEPAGNWAEHSKRILDIVDNQVRSLRKRQIIDSYKTRERLGTFWGIGTNIRDYELDDAMVVPFERSTQLALTPTRLKKLSLARQHQLMNWGYAVCDAAIRKHVPDVMEADTPAPSFPLAGGIPQIGRE